MKDSELINQAAIHLGYSSLNILLEEMMCLSLPTGFGKSLCYGLLPLVFDLKRFGDVSIQRSIVIVVSPLIALMRDQVQSFAVLRRRD